MKAAIALLYTPLHVASLVRTLPLLGDFDRLAVVYLAIDSPKFRHYRDVLRATARGPRLVELNGAGLVATWLRALAARAAGKRYFEALITGNPRRTQSLLAAQHAREIIIIDEGSGTTHRGGYFDPSFPERSRIKKALQRCRILPEYSRVAAAVRCHYTAYRNSIFNNPIHVPFSPVSPQAPRPSCVQYLVVSSLIRRLDPGRFLPLLEGSSADARSSGGEVWFCPHPADRPAEVQQVLASVPGVRVLDTMMTLEEYCTKVISAGGRVVLRGDANSSSLLLDELYEGTTEYVNETERMA